MTITITYDETLGSFGLTSNDPRMTFCYFIIEDTQGHRPRAGFLGPLSSPFTGTFQPVEIGGLEPGIYELRVFERENNVDLPAPEDPYAAQDFEIISSEAAVVPPTPPPSTLVHLQRSASDPTADDVLSLLIENWSTARQFNSYDAYIEREICRDSSQSVFASGSYERLRNATRLFLADLVPTSGTPGSSPLRIDRAGLVQQYLVASNGRPVLPYVADVIRNFKDALNGHPCSDIDPTILTEPLPVELIWSYWHEEAALVQTLNLILARFQNRRVGPGPDPLARFDLSPLRPLRHILWEWAEDETSRITVRRRAAEYEYEYGLSLVGRAIPGSGLFVERRTRFLEAFHTLLHACHVFFLQDDDTTVQSDAFPVLNALRETHLVLAEGAHNQFGDLPTEARVQMLIMQWLLAQPEMRDFLGGRPMVPYEEPWMDRVDTMKSIQGWTDTSVTYFRDLGVHGEQLLLSIRLANWNSVIRTDSAKNWARRWRPQIQRYVHAYRAVTGIDLTVAMDATMPSTLMARRVPARQRNA